MSKFLILVLLIPLSVSAQQKQVLRFDQVLELALRSNPAVRSAAGDVKVAESQYYESMADLLVPTVSGSFNFSYSDPDSVNRSLEQIRIGNQVITITNAWPDNYSSGINISKVLFNGFRNWNTKELQNQNWDFAKKKYEDSVRTVRNSVFTSFFHLPILEKSYILQRDLTEALSNRMEWDRSLFAKGQLSQLAFLQARSSYIVSTPKVVQAADAYANERNNLFSLMGLTNDDNVIFDAALEDLTNLTLKETNSETIMVRAISNDINLKTQDFAILSARINKQNTDAIRIPTVSGNFGYNYNYVKDNSVMNSRIWRNSWNAGLNLSVPIDDWLYFSHTANSIKEMQASLDKQLDVRTQTLLTLITQINTQVFTIRETGSTLGAQKDALDVAEQTMDLSREQLKRGLVMQLDYRDAELIEHQADVNYWQAWYDYANALVKMNTMMGF